jgi:RNA polymerase sigma factor (sigma-70 family)
LQVDRELIKDCAANNRLSQEKLYRMFYPSLILLCKRFFADDHEAIEALNDGMMKVFKKTAAYDAGKGEFFNWVYTIVRNTALDKIRLVRFQTTAELNESIHDPAESNPLKKLEWKDVYTLLNTLAPATRVVCSLYYLEGFSIKEISVQLTVSEGTVKWHLGETRKKLKPVLEKYYS